MTINTVAGADSLHLNGGSFPYVGSSGRYASSLIARAAFGTSSPEARTPDRADLASGAISIEIRLLERGASHSDSVFEVRSFCCCKP